MAIFEHFSPKKQLKKGQIYFLPKFDVKTEFLAPKMLLITIFMLIRQFLKNDHIWAFFPEKPQKWSKYTFLPKFDVKIEFLVPKMLPIPIFMLIRQFLENDHILAFIP